jgi:hypothetical protein
MLIGSSIPKSIFKASAFIQIIIIQTKGGGVSNNNNTATKSRMKFSTQKGRFPTA